MSRLSQFRSLPYSTPVQHLFPPTGSVPSFQYSSPLFSLRCFPSRTKRSSRLPAREPSALREQSVGPPPTLEHTTSPTLQPYLDETALAQRQAQLKRHHKPYTLELTLLVGKKKVHKSAVIRETCKRRFKEALRLVVCRGASKSAEGGIELKSGVRDGPRKWLVPGESQSRAFKSRILKFRMPQMIAIL